MYSIRLIGKRGGLMKKLLIIFILLISIINFAWGERKVIEYLKFTSDNKYIISRTQHGEMYLYI